LDQPHKNQKIWERIFKAKATGKYPMVMFNTIGKAAQLENGKSYSSMEELLNDFQGKPLQVFVKNEENKNPNTGKVYENTNVKQWNPTKFPQVQHQFKGNAENKGSNDGVFDGGIDISDDDMPF